MMTARRDQDYFWEGVDRGELLAQSCAACGTLRHPPAPACAKCRSLEWGTVPLSGQGTIHSWIVSRAPDGPQGPGQLVILVDLEEGFRLVSNLSDPDNARVGARVAVHYDDVRGRRLPLFRTVR